MKILHQVGYDDGDDDDDDNDDGGFCSDNDP